jgi:cytochrome c
MPVSIPGVVWDAETLSAFLTKPKDLIKGTSMAFPGLKKEKDVKNLIAYLANP